ncbi:hypothetical protein [Chryseobacterium sp.]|uniref:hypothetical protein n=1 Tax=Chryseobacterium sp. TaxID=1871047 RepID=UPI0024E1CBDB|nr:hypothetical protein [Chryseobacterium sp.]
MNLQEIYIQAKQVGLSWNCDERMTSDLSIKNLCEMYFDGDDWSMKNDFPKLEILRDFKGKSEVYGIFTDYVGMPNNLSKSAFFGNSDIRMIYNCYSVSQLVLRHQSKAKITVADNAILIINILDTVEVDIECIENARVEVFQYGGKIESSGDVRIHKSSFEK